MGLLETLKLQADEVETLSVEKREELEHTRKQWVRGAPNGKRGFQGRVLKVDDILIRDADGRLRKKYVRECVKWSACKQLANITTTVKRMDYKEKLENGSRNPNYGKSLDSTKKWRVVIYRTGDLAVGEFRIFGEAQQVPLVRELALVYAEMMRLGVYPTYVHENGGLCVRGEAVELGTTEDDLEVVREKYHLAMARATSTASTWVREVFYAKYGKEVGERLARAELKKMLAKPAANPDNLWGYGLKNKDTGEYDRLNLGGKYMTDKAKRSKKGGGKGGGGSFKVGSEPPVVKSLHRGDHKAEVERNIREYVLREMVKNPMEAEAELAVRRYQKQLRKLEKEKKVEPEQPDVEVLDAIEKGGVELKFCKQGRKWFILDHKDVELFGSARKSDVQARWAALKKGKV